MHQAIDAFEASRRKGGSVNHDLYLRHLLNLENLEMSECGGVVVSGPEMARSSKRISRTPKEVDTKPKNIMKECYI
jgi:hypothetical protein